MSEFKKVEHASFTPTKCVSCGTHDGPFIDLQVDLPVYGHLYICTSHSSRPGCLRQMARLDDMVEKSALLQLQVQVGELKEDLNDLIKQFGREKLVRLDDVLDYMER